MVTTNSHLCSVVDHAMFLAIFALFQVRSSTRLVCDACCNCSHSVSSLLIPARDVNRVPLYHEAKLVFLIWLAIPTFKGALKLWNDHNQKVDQYIEKFDQLIGKLQASAEKPVSEKKE